MKRYIKSFTTDQLKAELGDNYPKGGYLYIFKHGIGPGTIPNDVKVVRTKDLPNYYTAVWLDRFLTTSELKQYDIPSETRINELLDRIGYCQKNGDVVPCDEIEACRDIKASTYVSQIWLPEDKKWEDIQEYSKWDNSWCEGCGTGPYYDIEDARADGYRARIIVRDESGRYVDDIEASTKIIADAEYGKAPTIPDDRFDFVVYDTYMYDDIMEAIDNVCESTTGELYSENFHIEGPYSERFDVVDILKDFGVDWREI